MNKYKPTDDELLSYIIGDVSQELRDKIELWLEISPKNREYLKTILYFKKEIQKTSIIYRKKTWKDFFPVYAARFSALVFAFTAGLLIQAHWQPLSKESSTSSIENPSLSEPLSIEIQPSEKIL